MTQAQPNVRELAAAPAAPSPLWRALLRQGAAFLLLFALALLIQRLMPPDSAKNFPNPLWLPVILLSLQLGLGAGIAAAMLAAGIFVWQGLPPASWSEDFYQYAGRVAAEPVSWTFMALVIGYLRRHQIRERQELKAEVADRDERARKLANRCDELRARTDILERQIAANAQTSHVEFVEAICGLNAATPADFAARLQMFVAAVMGTTEFAVYLVRGNDLRADIASGDEFQSAIEPVLPRGSALYEAAVVSKRVLLAARAEDQGFLGKRDAAIGPLLSPNTPAHVIGLLRIGGPNAADFPEDMGRKFTIAQSEISRVLGNLLMGDLSGSRAASSPAIRAGQANTAQSAGIRKLTGIRVQ